MEATQESNVQALDTQDNQKAVKAIILQCAKDMAEIDANRKELNKQAAEIREVLKDNEVDTDAFRDVYGYYKKGRHDKAGYDDSHKLCFEVLNGADTGDLFSALTDKD